MNAEILHPSPRNSKPKIVVILGATGSGKSKLSIDLASFFPVEVINADSMQVYEGLDVLTNKLPIEERKDVPHHLLGVISANMEFTSKDFRDMAIPIIGDIISRGNLPVIVGGTNYYIQALVSQYLLDDLLEEMDYCSLNDQVGDLNLCSTSEQGSGNSISEFEQLKEIDPIAADRVHPNNVRKVKQYLNLHAESGKIPSKLLKGKGCEKWGRTDNSRYDCCFLWVDASLPVIDKFVNQRVDSMIKASLLDEVAEIYKPNSDYTRGLRQAIGVREFEEYLTSCNNSAEDNHPSTYEDDVRNSMNPSSSNDSRQFLLSEAIEQLKANTRRLVRRQRRRLNRLKTYFGWNIHYFDATEAILNRSDELWTELVVEPCLETIKAFLHSDTTEADSENLNLIQRDVWTQYVCEACGNRTLRGSYEWEQHKQGRGHRKRVLSLRKKLLSADYNHKELRE